MKKILLIAFVLLTTSCVQAVWPKVSNYEGSDYATLFVFDDAINYQLYYYHYDSERNCYKKDKERMLTRTIWSQNKKISSSDVYEFKIKGNESYLYVYNLSDPGYRKAGIRFVTFSPKVGGVYLLSNESVKEIIGNISLQELKNIVNSQGYEKIKTKPIEQWNINDVCPNIFGTKQIELP